MNELKVLIHEDNLKVRETDLAVTGNYREVWLFDGLQREQMDVIVDKLGRVFVPATPAFESVKFVSFEPDAQKPHRVLRRETRFEGEKETAYVLYLSELEAHEPEAGGVGNGSNGTHPPA